MSLLIWRRCCVLLVHLVSWWIADTAGSGHLYVTNGTNIFKINRQNDQYESVYSQRNAKIVGLAADIDANLLFWSDTGPAHRAIYSSRLDGTNASLVVGGVEECNGLSVDWVSKHIYWTDAVRRTLEIANYNGSGRRILVGDGLVNPRGIVVDPVFGFVFWADQGAKKIERSHLDGSERKVLVDKDLAWPNQMAVSYPIRRLYWVDAKKQSIMSCDVDGGDVTKERDLVEASKGNPVFGLVVIGNNAIVSTWFLNKISSTFVATRESVWKDQTVIAGSTELYSLVSTAPSIQPAGYHPCGQLDKVGCTHLCLPTRATSYRCACPTFGGLALSFNAKSCEAPGELLFFTLKESGEVGFISLRGAQSPYLTLAGRSSQPSAVTYDPIKQVVYWSDVDQRVIYRSSLAGTGDKEVFLNSSHGVGTVDGLALDWISQQLYFTNMGQSNPGLDGAVFSWHTLERISLEGTHRKTLVRSAERPRGIALDLENGLLFYGDWGRQPQIVQANLDGSGQKVILNTDLSNPNGLSFYEGRLYVADSNFNNKTYSPHLMVFDVLTSEWTPLKLSNNVSLPMGLAVQGDTLYYSDWVSSDSTKGYVKSFNLRFGVDNNVILSGKKPTGLHYSPLARRKQELYNAVCQNSSCGGDCVRKPLNKEKSFTCLCPDESARVLYSNTNLCTKPDNFLLAADLNTLKLIPLDDSSVAETQTLMYASVDSNFVALAYDNTTDTVYWSDLTRKSIFSSPLMDFKPSLIFTSYHYIDGLVVDTEKHRLFWTGYTYNGSGVIARLSLQRGDGSYHEVLEDLNNPRAIHIHQAEKILFWTEYGGKNSPACVSKAKLNGRHPKTLLSHGLFWPNALSTHGDRLFVADGAGKVFMMDFNGEEQEELSFLTGSALHIFGLVVMDTVIFYSDWFTNSIYMVDRVTGHTDVLASHLSRPTSIVVHHPDDLLVHNQCIKHGHVCADTCVPVPRSFHCSCSVGSQLASDKQQCIKMASPWEVTDESRCHKSCHMNAYCSQLVPLLKYQCVCKAGYEGDGILCSECGEDFYKPYLGNDTCYPCPLDSATLGSATATHCTCTNPQHKIVNGVCAEVVTTTLTTDTASTEDFYQETEDTTVRSSTSVLYLDEVTTDFLSTDDLPTGTVGQPYFNNCPQGEVMVMKLPESSSKIWLPINWTAQDAYGSELIMRSNFNISDNKILVPWLANGDAGQQTVVFEAKDSWHQTAICQFQVLLEDFVPPKLSSCPRNIFKKTSMNSEPISWTPPMATDNVPEPKIISSHEPKSEFPIGSTEVTYTAIDSAGNRAKCTFNVTIKYEQPCKLPEISNGRFRCDDDERFTICRIECYEGHILNPLGMFPRSLSCLADTDLGELIKVMRRQQPCLKQRRPTTALEIFSLTFEGPCLPEDSRLRALLREKVVVKLEEKRLCMGAVCSHSPLSIICAPEVNKRRNVENRFNMIWNVTIEYVPPQHDIYDGFSPGHIKRIVTDMKLELSKLAAHLNFMYNQNRYVTVARSVSTMDFQWVCLQGEMKMMDGCVPCPAGSYLNKSQEKCVLCNQGFYQNTSSQTSCLMCENGVTLEDGALNVTECVLIPSINEMSKFLIITVCSFGFIFLCMALFLYLHHQNQQKKAKEQKSVPNNTRFMTPNIYAQTSPPSQKCPDYIRTSRDFFMGSHDYEDIDGHNKATFETFSRRPPGCRDSLSSFRAPTDMTYLQSPSLNGTSSMRTSDETLMPNSPRGSTKSFILYGDGGYAYTASPNGTMGSFKGSPPMSPYRSLHMSANGPIPASGMDSPAHHSHMLTSLLGDESPYTSRLIRDRLIDPDSPYRIISHDRFNSGESLLKNRQRDLESHALHNPGMNPESPYRAVIKESPYRSTAIQVINKNPSESPPQSFVQEPPSSFRNGSKYLITNQQPSFTADEDSAVIPFGDFLYKRPPSPLFPQFSGKKSNDSLQRSPSTPRTSPGMSRKRLENSYRTPPMGHRSKSKPDFGGYEHD